MADLLETQVDGCCKETMRTTAIVGRHADAVHPRLVYRRQVQFGRHGTVRHDLVLLFVAEHVIHVQTVARVDRVDHHVANDTASADDVAAVRAVHVAADVAVAVANAVVVVIVAVAVMTVLVGVVRGEEERCRTLEHVVVGRHFFPAISLVKYI